MRLSSRAQLILAAVVMMADAPLKAWGIMLTPFWLLLSLPLLGWGRQSAEAVPAESPRRAKMLAAARVQLAAALVCWLALPPVGDSARELETPLFRAMGWLSLLGFIGFAGATIALFRGFPREAPAAAPSLPG